MRTLVLVSALIVWAAPAAAFAPPQQHIFSIDGYPVSCQGSTVIANWNLPDVGMARPGLIQLNPGAMGTMSTSMKLFVFAHECAHGLGIMNEAAADCWGIRRGRDQGWFPPQAFAQLVQAFRNNPGDYTHAPGPARLTHLANCYRS